MTTALANKRSVVAWTPAAAPGAAAPHFEGKLAFETDCADVWYVTNHEEKDFVVVDVRGPAYYATGHVPGAINIPTRLLNEKTLADYPLDTLFVVYCAGPHCNGSTKAALKLARMGRPVKEMIGGMTGWLDEGLGVARS